MTLEDKVIGYQKAQEQLLELSLSEPILRPFVSEWITSIVSGRKTTTKFSKRAIELAELHREGKCTPKELIDCLNDITLYVENWISLFGEIERWGMEAGPDIVSKLAEILSIQGMVISDCVDLIHKHARQQARIYGVDYSEFMGSSTMGLIRAMQYWRAEGGSLFINYSNRWIMEEIKEWQYGKHLVEKPAGLYKDEQKVDEAKATLTVALGRPPTAEEIAEKTELAPRRVESILANRYTVLSIHSHDAEEEEKGTAWEHHHNIKELTYTDDPDDINRERIMKMIRKGFERVAEENLRMHGVNYGIFGENLDTLHHLANVSGPERTLEDAFDVLAEIGFSNLKKLLAPTDSR